MFEANAKLPTGILRDYGLWSLLCYVSQELGLSTDTVILKQGKFLQHAAVYIIKFRMKSTKTEYLMTCIIQNIPA